MLCWNTEDIQRKFPLKKKNPIKTIYKHRAYRRVAFKALNKILFLCLFFFNYGFVFSSITFNKWVNIFVGSSTAQNYSFKAVIYFEIA